MMKQKPEKPWIDTNASNLKLILIKYIQFYKT